MYKKRLGTLHQYHSSLLKSKSDIHDKSTRQQYDIDMSKSTKFQHNNILVFKVGYAWNNLPFEIKGTKN